MRGNQLTRLWRVVRAIEASPNGLTVAEIAKREETGIRTICRDPEAIQAAGFPFYTNIRVQALSYLDQIQSRIRNTPDKVDPYEALFMREPYTSLASATPGGGEDVRPGPDQNA